MNLRAPLAVLAASALLAAGCTVPASQSADGGQDSGPKVVASFYPLQWLTQEIAGDGVAVGSLTPKGAEPHDSELELSQVSALGEADLLVTLGGFQAAVDQAAESNPPAEVLDVGPSVGIEGSDPHFWLDPAKLGLAAAPIGEALAKADPDGAEGYLDRAKAAADQLEILDAQLATALRPFEGAYLVTTHAAFNYFGQRYHLEQIAIVGIDPEAEPTPARLAEVRDQIGGLPVATIFFEEPASSKVAETLAAELGVKTARLNPVETDSGGDYITAMRDNLGALEQGLVRP